MFTDSLRRLLFLSSLSSLAFAGCESGVAGPEEPADAEVRRDAAVDAALPIDAAPPADAGEAEDGGAEDAAQPTDAMADAEPEPPESFRYADAVFASTHNSYSGGARGTILEQLEMGVRGLELDIHDNDFRTHGYRVGHDSPGDEVALGGGNPESARLVEWLEVIAEWSRENPTHAPITLTIDLKDDLDDNDGFSEGNLGYLNHLLRSVFGERLHHAEAAATPPPELPAGTVVAVLSGHRGTRLAYVRDRGREPAVALGAGGRVLEVHTSQGGGNLWYWTGELDGRGGVRFLRHGHYDTGKNPAVAVNDEGLVVEVHEADNDARLFYRVGQLAEDGSLSWFHTDGIRLSNDSGQNPTVRFVGDDGLHVREIHRSQNNPSQHWYWDGVIDPATKLITWTRGSDGGRTDDPLYDEASSARDGVTVSVLTGASGPHGSDTLLYRVDGGEARRIRYEQVFFVEVQPGDGASLEDDVVVFYAAQASSGSGRTWAVEKREAGFMSRLWGLNAEGQLTPVNVNYPATDTPSADWYRAHCERVSCLE